MGIHTGTPLLTEEGYVGPMSTAPRGSRPPATAARSSSRRASAACSAATACAISASTGSRTCRARADLPGRRDDFPPLKTLYQTNLPDPSDAVPRPRARVGRARRPPRPRRRSPADADRARRDRQDAACAAGRRRGRRALSRRRLLGSARAASRPRASCSRAPRRPSEPATVLRSTSATSGCCCCSTTSST